MKSVVYTITCTICLKEGVSSQYVGVSAEIMVERGQKHVADAGNTTKTSHIRKHLDQADSGVPYAPGTFKMQVVKNLRSALSRQIREAV